MTAFKFVPDRQVPYENIKDDEIEIDVTLVNLNNWPGSGAGWKTGSMAPSPMKKGGGSKKKVETTSHHLLPRMTFWIKKSQIKIKKGATANILVNCLPLRMAAHSCLVFVKDDKGLETWFVLRKSSFCVLSKRALILAREPY